MSNLNFIKEIHPEARLVLLIAKWIVYNDSVSEIKDLLVRGGLEWKKIKELLLFHELFPLSYLCLKEDASLLPDEEMESMRKSYYFCSAYTAYLWQEFIQIARIFNKENIELAPLKGIGFLVDNLYADKAYLRPMVDIDILIKKDRLPLAVAALESLGYEKSLFGIKEDYWINKNYHLSFLKKRAGLMCNVEAHWELDYKRDRSVLPYLWGRVKKGRAEDENICMLSPEDTLFSLALHQRRFGKMLSLKNACDVALLLNKYKTEFDWGYILKVAGITRMLTTLYCAFRQADLLFGIKIPPFALKALKTPLYKKRLIQWFIAKNTFGSCQALSSKRSCLSALYLKSHFLVYDNLREPIWAVLNIPLEQFAKFYGLPPYAKSTIFNYKFRYFYILKNLFAVMFRSIVKKIQSLSRYCHMDEKIFF